MKFLLDQNLSSLLVESLSDLFPGSLHLRHVGMGSAKDSEVWSYAAANGFAILSKDSDFQQRSFLFGHPPKVIWLKLGNCTSQAVADVLRRHHTEILAFDADVHSSIFMLG